MLNIFQSALRALHLYLMRRRQFDSRRLRKYFKKHYDIEIGMYSYGCFDRWRMPGPMQIGRYCSVAGSVRSALVNHPMSALTTHPALYESKFGIVACDLKHDTPLVIEDDVWIGHNVIILPGCKHIGRGAVIGAGSMVTRNVEAYTVVAGNPARKLRDRFEPDLIAAIEASQWWTLDLPDLGQLVRQRPDLVFRPTAELLEAWTASPGRKPTKAAVSPGQ